MNIRLGIIVSCLLVSVGYGMNPPSTSTSAPSVDPDSISALQWRMRRQLAQSIADAIRTERVQAIMACPIAPRALQDLWTEVQTRMGVVPSEQKSLRLITDGDYEFSTLYGISVLAPILAQHFSTLPQVYGYVRCSLLHEAAHVQSHNVDHAQRTIIDYVCGTLDDKEMATVYAKAAHAHFSNVFDIYTRLFLGRPDAQNLQAEEGRRIEHETDDMMLKKIDCEQCLRDYIFFVRSVDRRRIAEGYLGVHELEKRLHELADKRCAHHSSIS